MAEAPDFTVHKFAVVNGGPDASGKRLIGRFDLKMAGLKIVGCLLIEDERGIASAVGPIGKTHANHRVEVRINTPELSRAITRRVAEIYTLYTGREISDE